MKNNHSHKLPKDKSQKFTHLERFVQSWILANDALVY